VRVNRGGADRLAIGRRRDREPITWIVEDWVVRAIRTEEDGGRWSGRIEREQFQHAARARQSVSSASWRGWRSMPAF